MKRLTVLAILFLVTAGVRLAAAAEPGRVQPLPDIQTQRQVYDIRLHEPRQLQQLLQRLDELSGGPRRAGPGAPQFALVLHGPEVEFFAVENYPDYRELVDLAARLDAFEVIEVKVCQARMQALGLTPEDMPAFVEQVRFGPAEVERLEREGYVRM